MKFADPFKILTPSERWAPTQDQMDAFQNAYEKPKKNGQAITCSKMSGKASVQKRTQH